MDSHIEQLAIDGGLGLFPLSSLPFRASDQRSYHGCRLQEARSNPVPFLLTGNSRYIGRWPGARRDFGRT